MNSTVPTSAEVSTPTLTLKHIRLWGVRSGVSVVDQGLTSGTGFVMNLLLARWLTGRAYGAFTVVFATVLFLSGFHNVLILEPLSVIGPANYPERLAKYFLAQFKLHSALIVVLSFGLVAGAIVAARVGTDTDLVHACGASAVALPPLLSLWLVRRMCYVLNRPSRAAWASAAYFILVVVGLVILHAKNWLNLITVFCLIGAVSTLAAPLAFLKLDTQTAARLSVNLKSVARENWRYGRWLVASTALFSVSNQIQTYLSAALLGLEAAGILRAMQVPSLVVSQVITAIGFLVLPVLSYDFGAGRHDRLHKKAILASVFLTSLAVAYLVVLTIFSKSVAHLLYGNQFSSHAGLIPILALIPVCTGFSVGFGMAVRALQKPYFDLFVNAVAAPVGVLSAIFFMRWWGLHGAAISMVVTFLASASVYFLSYRHCLLKKTDPVDGTVLSLVN